MAILGFLALVAAILGVYYSRGQLHEAKRIREQSKANAEIQMKEDNLWAEKYINAGKLLCRIADMDRPSMFTGSSRVMYLGGSLGMLFGEDVRKQILGQLIEKQDDNTYALRPIDTSQLRLKATRGLIDLVLETVTEFRTQQPGDAKKLGL